MHGGSSRRDRRNSRAVSRWSARGARKTRGAKRKSGGASEEASERSQFGVDTVFDPHAVLGVSPDANRESIVSAYEQAKSKYDAEQVAHLSAEVQEHFRQKAQAVERAYQMLTAAV